MIYIRFIDSLVKRPLVTRLESRHFRRNVQTIPTKPNPVGHSSSFFSFFFSIIHKQTDVVNTLKLLSVL